MPSIRLARETESAESLFSAAARLAVSALVVARFAWSNLGERRPRPSRAAAKIGGESQTRWPDVNCDSPPILRGHAARGRRPKGTIDFGRPSVADRAEVAPSADLPRLPLDSKIPAPGETKTPTPGFSARS